MDVGFPINNHHALALVWGVPFTIPWAVLVTCQWCALDVLMFKIFLLVNFHLTCEQTHADI